MTEEQRLEIIGRLKRGEQLSTEWRGCLFPLEKQESELVYGGKQREEDILLHTMAVPLQSVRTFSNGGGNPTPGDWYNPDFFLKIGELVVVVEIKDASELANPLPENVKKNEYAIAHFARVNEELNKVGNDRRYVFHFLASVDFPDFFAKLRADDIRNYRSKLDVKLDEELVESEPVS